MHGEITLDAYPGSYYPCAVAVIEGPNGERLPVWNDWDAPGTARAFGWDIATVRPDLNCDHDGTDGTVNCTCGATVAEFMGAALEFIRDNDGATAPDPGYWGE